LIAVNLRAEFRVFRFGTPGAVDRPGRTGDHNPFQPLEAPVAAPSPAWIRPFKGLRSRPDLAARVSAPPYDVVSTDEARAYAAGNPDSFFHVSRPEIDLPPGTDVHAPEVYAQAAKAFADLQARGALVRDPAPAYYLYRLTMGGRSQLGLAAEVPCDAYTSGRVKRHEFTRPDKEDDRLAHIESIGSNSGPVFLVYRKEAPLRAVLGGLAARAPDVDFTSADGIRHEFWVVAAPAEVQAVAGAAGQVPALYIADGHHRCAAAARACANRRAAGGDAADGPHNFFFAVMFDESEVKIFDYNRIVKDLNGLSPEAFLAKVRGAFTVAPAPAAFSPARAGEFAMNLQGAWYKLSIDAKLVPQADPVKRLDVSLLQDHLLAPVLGIEDPRRDKRIDFVGGIRGLGELSKRVAAGEAVAFAMHPTSLAELLAVADVGEVMPPKSTWFEPKLRDGLVCQLLRP
jgi:uncharacterized protein (DUF1015 family)